MQNLRLFIAMKYSVKVIINGEKNTHWIFFLNLFLILYFDSFCMPVLFTIFIRS